MDLVGLFSGERGLEIGGPSPYFQIDGPFPIYLFISELDGCNFSSDTIWQGKIEEGKNYRFDKDKVGNLFICDVVDLPSRIPTASYDFVLSCHVLEHVANPLKAFSSMIHVLRRRGVIVLVLPKKTYNFDHNRPITPFSHLIQDYEQDVKEDDLSHLDEILRLHDLRLDPQAGTFEQFRQRSLRNKENRALHHHVFDMETAERLYEFFDLSILFKRESRDDFLLVGG